MLDPPRPADAGADPAELPPHALRDWLAQLATECGFDLHPLTVRRNRRVYRAGEREGALYLLKDGLVATEIAGGAARPIIVDLFGPGEVFGELCLGRAAPRADSALVLRDAVMLRIPAAAVIPRLSDQLLCRILFAHFAARHADALAWTALLLSCNAEQRLALSLVRFAAAGGAESPAAAVTPPLTHQELARAIGTTRSRVCSFLTRFRAQGLVTPGADGGLLVDIAALRAHVLDLLGAVRPGRSSGLI